jgi:hypothetical protein
MLTSTSKAKDQIRHPASRESRLCRKRIGHLLKRPVGPPVPRCPTILRNFTYQAGSWTKPHRVVTQVEWHPGELYSRWIQIKAISEGYDLTIGIVYEGSDGSSKCIFDLMGPEQPKVDRAPGLVRYWRGRRWRGCRNRKSTARMAGVALSGRPESTCGRSSPPPSTPQLAGKRAYKGRLGNDRSPRQTRHPIGSAK